MDFCNLPEFDIGAINNSIQSAIVETDTPIQHIWSDEQLPILKRYIQSFENELDQEHEVGIMMTNFGQTILMQVVEISCEPPVLMVFRGYVDGRMATLIQHVNQLNFMLTSIEKDPNRPKRKIGFRTCDDE